MIPQPAPPYTSHLITSLPRIGDDDAKQGLEGAPPNLADPPPGCRFHPRCPLAIEICRRRASPMVDVAPGHRVACWVSPADPIRAERRREAQHESAALLDVDHVGMTYAAAGCSRAATGRRRRQPPARSGQPEIFAIIGESGSGKTTLARMILNLAAPTDGTIRFRGADVTTNPHESRRMAFMRQVQPIFQNPFEAFNPLKRIDRYLFVARGVSRARAGATTSRPGPTRRCIKVGLSLAEVGPLSRTSCPAGNCSGSPSRAR